MQSDYIKFINLAKLEFTMVQEIVVEYNFEKCIGAKKCIETAPNYFSFDGKKAVLLHSRQKGGRNVLNVQMDDKQLLRIKKAAKLCPVNAIKVSDAGGKVLVSDAVGIKSDLQEIKAEYDDLKEFVMDDKGHFLIRINPAAKEIEVAFCPELNKVTVKIRGRKPLEIYQTIIKAGLLSKMDHAAYLGRELQKAYIALQKNIPYVQDDELKL